MYIKSFECTHNILEPVLEWPFGYIANHCNKSLLMKDLFLLGSYAHFSTATYFFHFSDTRVVILDV
jgi:hypothetical protein